MDSLTTFMVAWDSSDAIDGIQISLMAWDKPDTLQ